MTSKRVLFVITEDWALISHRLHLIDAAILAGYEVGIATRICKHLHILKKYEVKIFNWNIKRRSLNPIKEFFSFLEIYKILWIFKPDIIHAVAQKPVIYSGLARMFYAKVYFIANLGGLGFIFTNKSLRAKLLKLIVTFFLKLALMKKQSRLILQNQENIVTINKLGIIDSKNIRLVRGAGIEIEKFLPSQIPNNIPTVILPGRLLWDKGVAEFIRTAKRIKARNIKSRFVLVGNNDADNPECVPQAKIDEWVSSGIVEHWGRCDNMEIIYQKISIVCLPSYNEGLPKVLLEAASCSRPAVAFDVPGCREVIENNVNGFLVEFGNEYELEKVLTKLINNNELCNQMGEKGRKIVEREFSSKIINTQIFNIWKEMI